MKNPVIISLLDFFIPIFYW